MSHAKRGMETLIGWTTPSTTYDRMRLTNTKAQALDTDVQAFVDDVSDPSGNFRKAWGVWLKTWNDWYAKTLSLGAKATTNLLNSDEIAKQEDTFSQDLSKFQATYEGLKDKNGNALPSHSPSPTPAAPQVGIPFWWMIAGVAVVGLGAFLYWRYKKTSELVESRRKMLDESLLPFALATHTGAASPAFAKAALTHGHDPAPALPATSTCGDCGRDLEVTPVPRAATKYYLSGV